MNYISIFENFNKKHMPKEISIHEFNDQLNDNRILPFTTKEKEYIKNLFTPGNPLEHYTKSIFSDELPDYIRNQFKQPDKYYFTFHYGAWKIYRIYKTDDDYYLINKRMDYSHDSRHIYFLADQIKELKNYLESKP